MFSVGTILSREDCCDPNNRFNTFLNFHTYTRTGGYDVLFLSSLCSDIQSKRSCFLLMWFVKVSNIFASSQIWTDVIFDFNTELNFYRYIVRYTIKPVYKGHSREPANVTFMNSCPLCTGYNYIALFINGENETAFNR